MLRMKLIGIAGTNGSGKDTVGHLLAQKHNYLFISASDLLREECRKRNLPVERENLRAISAEWRREGGLGVLVDKALQEYENHPGQYAGLAVASVRNPGEGDRVHELGGILVWVDADSRVRYDRIQAANRGRGEEDTKTFAQFLAEEEAEMHSSGDAAMLNMSAVQDRCDTVIINEGTETELASKIKQLL